MFAFEITKQLAADRAAQLRAEAERRARQAPRRALFGWLHAPRQRRSTEVLIPRLRDC